MTDKISLINLVNLQNETTATNAINANNAALTTALDNTLSLDGTSPNQMGSNLDMNNNQIINLPYPATNDSPLRLVDYQTLTGGGNIVNVPTGGTSGQLLIKNSSTNYDMGWSSLEPLDLVGGTNITVTGNYPATVATTSTPSFTTINTATVPTAVDTFVLRNTTDTLTNKTLTAPVISTISNTGTLTLPTGPDTLVARTSTDTLTNKTLTSPTLTTPVLGTPSSGTLTSCTGLPISGIASLGTGVATALAANVNGTGAISLTTSPTLITPTLGAATATSVTFSPTTGGIIGTTTNDNTTTGNVGEYVQSVIASGSAVSLSTATSANVTSISLTAGDWDISGTVNFSTASTTSCSGAYAGISTTSATFDSANGRSSGGLFAVIVPGTTSNAFNVPIGPLRFSLASTTTIYLIAYAVFTIAASSAYGILHARRVR